MRKIIYFFILACSLVTTCVFAFNDPQLEINKKNVVAFYNEIINQKNFPAALTYMGEHYTQHNPLAADGAEGLKNYIQYLKQAFPNAKTEIKRVFAEGDYVTLHVHTILEPNSRGLAVMDIFRLENGKIVEHWDVTQAVPEKSANTNGMF